jgi:hypothetical protein
MAEQLRGPFGKFANSPYYSESEVYGGAMAVSFLNKVNPRTLQTVVVCTVINIFINAITHTYI